MFLLEFKLRGKPLQFKAIDEGIRTVQFVRNKCVRHWMDSQGVGKAEVHKHTTQLRKEFEFVKRLNSTACQQAGERGATRLVQNRIPCRWNIFQTMPRA